MDIKTDAKVISQVAMPEIRAWGETARGLVFRGPNIHPAIPGETEHQPEASTNQSEATITGTASPTDRGAS